MEVTIYIILVFTNAVMFGFFESINNLAVHGNALKVIQNYAE
jgi:hypothetical protein